MQNENAIVTKDGEVIRTSQNLRDTREESAPGSGYALSMAEIRDRINGA